jgi:iron(III) transport system substrate-binding protein
MGKLIGIISFIIVLLAGLFLATKKEESRDSAQADDKVVVCYVAHDREFSEPILREFEKRTGIKVQAVYDAESTKTVGLVNRLLQEQERPRCDVFWNNEIVNTVRLKHKGVLTEYRPQAAQNFPPEFRDRDGKWTGFAARARVLIVNTELVKEEETPAKLSDLLDPKWQGKIGIAKPLFGSTATWVATIYTEDLARMQQREDALKQGQKPDATDSQFAVLQKLVEKQKLKILGGNKQTAQAVSGGDLPLAFTDTDDALGEKESGKPVKIVYLDSAPDGSGTLFFPNTLSLIANCPHQENAKKLVEYLLSPEIEIQLANGPAAQIPVNPALKPGEDFLPRCATPQTARPFPADWDEVAKRWEPAMEWARNNFDL